MKTTKVLHVARDHVEKLTKRSPVLALSELIWNALDADAKEVVVEVHGTAIDGIEKLVVKDNGDGMERTKAEEAFENLGGSWKKGQTSPAGRRYHGQQGEGRFAAFSLGNRVQWRTWVKDAGSINTYEVTIDAADLLSVTFSDPTKSKETSTRTEVEITNVRTSRKAIEAAPSKLAEQFALYLGRYPGISVTVDGKAVDPSVLQSRKDEYALPVITAQDGTEYSGNLTIIEWRHPVERELVLCGPDGHAFRTIQPNIRPGSDFDFTAYLQSDLIARLNQDNALDLAELHPDLNAIVEAAKTKMRGHFKARALEKAKTVVDQWKSEEIYPFTGPATGLAEVERQVFDVVALNVVSSLPKFEAAEQKTKRFSFHMLRIAIEQNPGALSRIMEEVLGLAPEKVTELSELLTKTTLTAMINASQLIVDRLHFLKGLRALIFDYAKHLKERKELHRILAKNTWLFGEEFNLAVDDESLNKVLAAHRHLLGEPEDKSPDPVTLADGGKGVVDLMLSRQDKTPGQPTELHHLVVELKRPSKKIDSGVLSQTKGYALAVSRDKRFAGVGVKWTFIAVSSEMNEDAAEDATQQGRPVGLVLERPTYTVWAKTWAQILSAAETRLEFFQRALAVLATEKDGLDHVRKLHQQYIPVEAGGTSEPAKAKAEKKGPKKAQPKKSAGKPKKAQSKKTSEKPPSKSASKKQASKKAGK